MTARPHSRLRPFAALAAACFLLAVLLRPAAAQSASTRYIYLMRNPLPGQQAVLINKVAVDGGTPVGNIFFPDLGFIGIVAVFPQPVVIAGDGQVEVVRDVLIYTQAGPLGAGWVQNQFQQPAPGAACNDTRPVVYVVDTGISSAHADFTWPPGSTPALTFEPGFSYAKDTNTGLPLPEYPDNHDHGTRVAGCLGGRTTGLLGPLGGQAAVKSIAIFDTPQTGNVLVTFASQAINGILRAVTDHKARRALPYLKSRASVLVFAHSTRIIDGRFAAIDNAIEKAWQAGMHVAICAGNEAVNAALVSPAGAAWGYTLPGPVFTRFWNGALPPGAVLTRAAQEFTIAGGYDLIAGVPQLWAQTNRNIGAGAAVDGFAPGANVPCAAAVGPPYAVGSGTSYATGLTAAMLTWEAWMRPWATPSMARTWLNNSMTAQPGGWQKVETPALPAAGLAWADWIEAYYPLATSTPAQRDPSGDPDGDGFLNLVEYFAGGDPRFVDAVTEPKITLSAIPGTDRITVRMPAACYLPPSSKVTWALEQSTNLTAWTTVPTGSLSPVLPVQMRGDGAISEVTVALAAGQRRFFRIKFTYTP